MELTFNTLDKKITKSIEILNSSHPILKKICLTELLL